MSRVPHLFLCPCCHSSAGFRQVADPAPRILRPGFLALGPPRRGRGRSSEAYGGLSSDDGPDDGFPSFPGSSDDAPSLPSFARAAREDPEDDDFEPELEDAADMVRIVDLPPTKKRRLRSKIGRLDEVFGDCEAGKLGFTRGTSFVISGPPGVGKSTLFTQLSAAFCRYGMVVYGCGEESPERVRDRAERLGLFGDPRTTRNFHVVDGSDWDSFEARIRTETPVAFVVDSISVYSSAQVGGNPGGVTQAKYVGKAVADLANRTNCVALIVSHVTKNGELAGPKALEHEVDVVSTLERAEGGRVRLSLSKNRFGGTQEEAFLKMKRRGLVATSPPDESHGSSESLQAPA